MSLIVNILENIDFNNLSEEEIKDIPNTSIVNADDIQEQETKYYIPSKKELDAHILEQRALEEKRKESELQNQTHGNSCGVCIKFQRQTPNMQSIMGYCTFNGVMVTKHQTSCSKFKERKKTNL